MIHKNILAVTAVCLVPGPGVAAYERHVSTDQKGSITISKTYPCEFIYFDSLPICEVECDVTLSSLSAHFWRLNIAEVEHLSINNFVR